MAQTSILYATACVYGTSSFNGTSNLRVGRDSTDAYYKGRLTFQAIPAGWMIKRITLKLTRVDTYATHSLLFGGGMSGEFSAALDFSFTQSVSSGTNTKSIDLTTYASVIKGFGGTWYLHIRHGSGSNSWTEFNGDEDADGVRPQLVIEYDLGTVQYNNGGVWTECSVWYYNGTKWVQVIPYYNSAGEWVLV